MRFSDSREYLYPFPTEASRPYYAPTRQCRFSWWWCSSGAHILRRALLAHLHHDTIADRPKQNFVLPQLSRSLLRICDADVGGVPMKQRPDKAERLAQQADAQALARR